MDRADRFFAGFVVISVLIIVFLFGMGFGKYGLQEYYERECMFGRIITLNGTEFTCEQVEE